MNFPAEYEKILERVDSIDPARYARTRNFIDGAVSYLSPYISRGVISTSFVMNRLLEKGYKPSGMEKFIQELAWRDYFQQVWVAKGEGINTDLKSFQTGVENRGIPLSIVEGSTGIEAIDMAIRNFYETGYLHNHVRMYIASLTCHIGRSHWWVPARWMYYHLLDADWASNALSWQWVAGTSSSKKYVANQENINRYCHTAQRGTFLDVDYSSLDSLPVPESLREISHPVLKTPLPLKEILSIDPELPALIYNSYNLDPVWKKDLPANRILLLEPSHFETYPISGKTMDFILRLSKNIPGIQLYVGEFDELVKEYSLRDLFYKEHPLNQHYRGTEEPRDWMFPVKGYYPSFFAFWKKCETYLG